MRIRDFSIRFNLALLILTTSVLAVVLASLGFAIYERQSYRASAVRELTALAGTLGANTAASLAFNDPGTAKEMLGALATEPHILLACLYDNQGHIFAEYRSSGAPPRLAVPAWRPDGAYFASESLTLFRGVLLSGERTGSIALVFSLSDFRSLIVEYAKIAMLVLLVSVLITFLISLRLARFIGDPLVRLAAVARCISTDKDYSVRAQIDSGGETGLLIESFNEMLSQIESRELAIKGALRSLKDSPPGEPTTACGTGISPPTKSISLPVGTTCSVTRRTKSGPDPKIGSATFIRTILSGSALRLPRIATARLRSS